MKKMNLEKQDIKKISFLVVIITILLIGLIVILVAINNINKKEEAKLNKKRYSSISDFETIADVANYMECEYKKKEDSSQENYRYDIYMKLKVQPYEDGISNENYYDRLVYLIAKVLNYTNYRIIDKEKDLIIDVVCDDQEEKVKTIYINGESSYFSVNDSINKINNKSEEKITKIDIQSNLIKKLQANNWNSSKVDVGKMKSSFNGYRIYFDEGYEIKDSNRIVFNVVFTEKYKENVINGIKTTATREEIIEKLGEPTFENDLEGFIGYKSEDIYVFCNTKENEISIYRIDKSEVNFSDIEDIFKEYKTNKDTVKLIYGIKSKWPDYTGIDTNKNNLYVEYITKGIKLEYNKANRIFNVYSNCNIKLTSDNLKDYKFINIIDKDSYYLAEMARNDIKSQALYTANDEVNEENRKLKTNEFCLYIKELDDNSYKAKVISISNKYMKSEIRENINSFIWASDTVLIYSVKGKGIYAYNAVTGKYTVIKTANATFELKKYEDGTLYYDNTSISLK